MKKIFITCFIILFSGIMAQIQAKTAVDSTYFSFEKQTIAIDVNKLQRDTIIPIQIIATGKKVIGFDFSVLKIISLNNGGEIVANAPAINYESGSTKVTLTYKLKIKLDTSLKVQELFPLTLGLSGKKNSSAAFKINFANVTVNKTDLSKKNLLPMKAGFEKQVILLEMSDPMKDTSISFAVIMTGDNHLFNLNDLKVTSEKKTVTPDVDKPVLKSNSGTDTLIYKLKIHPDTSFHNEYVCKLQLNRPTEDSKLVEIINPTLLIYIVKKDAAAGKSSLRYPPTTSFVTYTDFQGFKGDRPNGLVQIETNFNYYFKQDSFTDLRKVIVFRNAILGINLTKLDDKLRYKQINYDVIDSATTIKHIHTFDLLRYSNFNIYSKINILSWNMPRFKLRFYWDTYGALYSTGIRDSTLKTDQDFNINSLGLGSSFKICTHYKQNEWPINAAFTVTGFYINSFSNNIRQRVGPLYYPDSDQRNNKFVSANVIGGKTMTIFQFELQYSPSQDLSKNGKIFFRTSYYSNVFYRVIDNHSNSDSGNNFLQVQLGYAGTFDELVGGFFPKKTSAATPKDVQSGK